MGLLVLGWISILLAIVGAALPLVPTTPFLLLAAACFVRTSPAVHEKMLANRYLGPYLKQWDEDHSVPIQAKRRAILVVIVTFTASLWLLTSLWPRIAVALAGLVVLWIVSRLRTAEFNT